MIRNQYHLADYQADRETEAVQASAQAQDVDALLVAGELTVIEAYILARERGMVLVAHRKTGRVCIAPQVLPGWRLFPLVTPPEQAATFFPRFAACAPHAA